MPLNILNHLSLPRLYSLNNYPLKIIQRSLIKIQDEDFTFEILENSLKGIAVCTMTRTKAKNAMNRNLISQMKKALEIIKFEKSLTVMLLRSSVLGVFCAGADLKERSKMAESEVGPYVSSAQQLTIELSDLPVPTIAALDGAALGGGLEFALSCDLRVASSNAKMGLVETRLAIIPGAGGTQRLSRLIGASSAKDLILTARVIEGEEAHRMGVVNYVVQQNANGDAAYNEALRIASTIAANGPIALRMAKKAINKGSEVDLLSGLAFEQACYAQVIPTKDRLEGLKAFMEKRTPLYTGE